MRYLFVTVGTSAITNPDIGKAPDNRDNMALSAEVRSYLNSRDQQIRRWINLKNKLIQAHQDYWTADEARLLDSNRFQQTSAELTSTWMLLKEAGRMFDRIYLLASDTDSGELAAEINCAVMKECWPDMPETHAKRVRSIDLDFTETLASINRTLLECGVAPNDHVIFNITGGYKGTVPAITLAAQARSNCELFYQHESREIATSVLRKGGKTWLDYKIPTISAT